MCSKLYIRGGMRVKKPNYIESGIIWIHKKSNEKQFLIFASILVGLSAGLAAVILKLFVSFIRHTVVDRKSACRERVSSPV